MAIGDAQILSELSSMREAQREDHGTVVAKVDTLADTVNNGFRAIAAVAASHELENTRDFNSVDRRLQPLESVHSAMRWMVGAGIVASFGAIADFIFNHFPKVR